MTACTPSLHLPATWGCAFLRGEVWAAELAIQVCPDATVQALLDLAHRQVTQSQAAGHVTPAPGGPG